MNAKHLLALVAVVAALYAGYRISVSGSAERAPGQQDPLDRYQLYTPAELAEVEMQRELFFRYYHGFALKQCWHEVRDVAQNGDACRQVIEANHAGCVQALSLGQAGVVHGRDAHRALSTRYFQCVNPLRYPGGHG